MITKKEYDFRIRFIFFGLIFLCEPFIYFYDVLPDIIGVALILIGSYKLSFFEEKIRKFRTKFTKYMWLSICRIAILIISNVNKDLFDSTMILTFAFVFAVFDCILLIPAFTSFCEGLEYLYMRNVGDESLKGFENVTSGMSTLSVVFVSVRSAAAFAPMLTVLALGVGFETISTVLYFGFAIIALIFGITFIVSARRYYMFFDKDKVFNSNMEERYRKEIIPDKYLWNSIYANRYSIKATCALIFLVGLTINKYYFLPEFMYGVLLIWGLFDIKEHIDKKKTTKLVSIYVVVAILSYISKLYYVNMYGQFYNPYLMDGFVLPFAISSFLMIIQTIILIYICKNKREYLNRFVDLSAGLQSERHSDSRIEKDLGIRNRLKKKVKGMYILEIIFSIIIPVCFISLPFFEEAWSIQVVFSIVLIIDTYLTTQEIRTEAEMAI